MPAVLRQKGCRFDPHVLVVRRYQRITVVNEDLTEMEFVAKIDGREPIARRLDEKTSSTLSFEATGVAQLTSSVHPWMTAFVVVTDNDHVVTSADGAFTFRNVPPGPTTVTAWHERFGERSQRLDVTSAGTYVEFTFGEPERTASK